MTKTEIIDGIHILVSNNVIGDKQLLSRYKGFRAELFFENYLKEIRPDILQLEGGIIISKDSKASSLDNAIYLSIICENGYSFHYKTIYEKLSKLDFKKLYLIKYSVESWIEKPVMEFANHTISCKVPEMEICEFDKSQNTFKIVGNDINIVTDFFQKAPTRNQNTIEILNSTKDWLIDNLKEFSEQQLLKIYMNRLILDGYIGFGKLRGKPSDIDVILKSENKDYRLIEIKEKDLPKSNKKGFGLDVPRLKDFQRIMEVTKLKYFLIVRHIDNQKERNLVGWKFISIEKFANDVQSDKRVLGGTGMRSKNTINETLICSLDLFAEF